MPSRLGRGLLALVAGSALVLVTGGFVGALAAGSPPPADVVSGARGFVARQTSWSYTAAVSVSVAMAGGAQLVRPLAVRGTALAGRATDLTVTDQGAAVEYRALKADPGVWVRSAPTGAGLASVTWTHARSYAAFEAHQPGTTPSAVAERILVDALASGDILPALVAAAGDADRHRSSVRTLDVTFAAHTALGALAGLVTAGPRGPAAGPGLAGTLGVDARDRPRHLEVTVAASRLTVTAAYDVTWGTRVAIPPPPPGEVAGEVAGGTAG